MRPRNGAGWRLRIFRDLPNTRINKDEINPVLDIEIGGIYRAISLHKVSLFLSDFGDNYYPVDRGAGREASIWRVAGIFIFIFFLSGLSGLIYESIWSHYLKLFLGHAAYAQSLVLAIFMGGMAIGSWFAGAHAVRWKNLLVAYALAEGAIGVFALVFHNAFDQAIQLAFTQIIPALDSATAVHVFKWGMAALLILPQSILLGMTFPLMTAGIMRRYRHHSGETIAILYFSNSLGGAIGVLLSGFLLIGLVGLPGTITAAGIVNVLLATFVWVLARNHPQVADEAGTAGRQRTDNWYRLLLVAALVTGAASFMYEIAWIRMLSMVLGSSTHAFELMLSAFIFGLAFGGLWIRRRIRHITDPVFFTAIVQLAMGALALASLVVYGKTFHIMHGALEVLTRTDSGYLVFNLASHVLTLLVMLPATFCAGMTLPLMTYALFRKGYGEQSIGRVYAANTIGAILGVVLSVHVLITFIGVKGLVITGAALDIVLGVVLIGIVVSRHEKPLLGRAAAFGISALLVAVFGIQLDPAKMASGVYRHGRVALPDDYRIQFHKDGKTASISLYESADGIRIISTNGKPDASIQMAGGESVADEVTMALAAALPIAHHPDARTVANIGMGSGLTTHTLLTVPGIERLDTVEIEAAMVEGAMGFRPRVERAFTDPRSRIYIEDAKTYFSTYNRRYDLIVSEPSNPWVSGVASLFTGEFYRSITQYLEDDGIFVQWLQIYEIDTSLISSVIMALSGWFEDYAIYNTDSANILIVARKQGSLGAPDDVIFDIPELREELARVSIAGMEDILARRIGSRDFLQNMFRSYGTPANSDYFPYLDLHAAKSRYLGKNALELNQLNQAPVPLLEMLDESRVLNSAAQVTPNRYFYQSLSYPDALALRDRVLQIGGGAGGAGERPESLEPGVLAMLMLQTCRMNDDPELFLDSILKLAINTIPYLSPDELRPLWSGLQAQHCFVELGSHSRTWMSLFEQLSNRDGPAMARTAHALLESGRDRASTSRYGYLITVAMLGYLNADRPREALVVWNRHVPHLLRGSRPNIYLELLYYTALDGGSLPPEA